MRAIADDLRYGFRVLAGGPGYALSALLTLALGIAFNTATFSVINAVLLRPLPYAQPENLLLLRERKLPQFPEFSVSPGNFLTWEQQAGADFVGMAAFQFRSANLQTGSGDAERVEVDAVGARLFELLGVTPLHGRPFSRADEEEGAAAVALLSYSTWQGRFGGDPRAIGRTIHVDLRPVTIVGVMPEGFAFPNARAEMWVPLVFSADDRRRYGSHYLSAIARVRPGVTVQQARTDLGVVARRLAEAHPDEDRGWEVLVNRLQDYVVRNVRPALLVLIGAVGLVLLIACANVANLLLARGAGRQKEFAVRSALGATRTRLVRQLLIENGILAVSAAAVGLLSAGWLLRLLVILLPGALPRESEIALDGTVLAFTAGLAIMTPLLFGVLPAVYATRVDLRGTLASGGRQGSAPPASRTRFALAVVEIALAMVLLVGAGLLLRSFAALSGTSPGFAYDRAVMVRLNLPEAKYAEGDATRVFFSSVLDRVQALPSVAAAGLTVAMPLVNDFVASFEIEGTSVTPSERPSANFFAVSPGYFSAMRLPLVRGRLIADTDRVDTPRVAVINQTMADRFFRGRNPIGHRIKVSQGADGWREIVGIVGDVSQYGLDVAPRAQVYESWQQHPYFSGFVLVVRASGPDAAAVVPELRNVVRGLDPDVPVSGARTLESVVDESIRPQRFSAALIGAFAISAVVLAAIGLYGVLAYMVGQRGREFAIRVAHGASRADILRLVLRNAAGVSLAGLVGGVAGALLLRRVVAGLLFGVSANDPATYATVAVLLLLVTTIASVVPALRATRADPIVALRAD